VLLGCTLVVGFAVCPKLGVTPREKDGVLIVPKLNAGFVVAAVLPKIGVLEGNEGETPNVGTLVGNEKAGAKKTEQKIYN